MKRVLLLVVMIMAHVALFAHEPVIIPTPRHIVIRDGYFRITPHTTIGTTDKDLQPIVEFATQEIGLVKSFKAPSIKLFIDDELDVEEYKISVTTSGVSLSGGGYG
jgi:hypothetical protein